MRGEGEGHWDVVHVVITLQEEASSEPSRFQLRLCSWSPCCSRTADTHVVLEEVRGGKNEIQHSSFTGTR